MKYISFVWWIAKYCDFFYFFLFVICVCLHPHINTPAVNCEERSKLSTGGYQLTGRVHGLSERSINTQDLTAANICVLDYLTLSRPWEINGPGPVFTKGLSLGLGLKLRLLSQVSAPKLLRLLS